ncbi:gfo/Idh/MocA family oxidoreductase [Symbioplanes lichenis]|uniref:gfo/Idh/MocA family oxidoreductase n=1 Tax=Symbioplanes lichenis TaxID=1629072 RepID=UPI0027381C0B|nr:gfo/Idh/MocA family oxidoreductase [Actinoplanes lichenis]
MTTFVLAGSGFRGKTLLRVSSSVPDLHCVGVVGRAPGPLSRRLADFPRPAFVVTALPRAVTPSFVAEAVALGLPVLAETPPAPDLAGLRALWAAAGSSGLVQVAEQYLLMPTHAARLAAVRSGIIGTPTQVQVSSTQQYHAVSLIRGLLGAGHAPASVRAVRFVAPLLDPLDRSGWVDSPAVAPATTTIATVDFGGGRSGVYDFTSNQTRNQLRFRRLLVRGSRGELRDDELIHLAAPRTIVRVPLVRAAGVISLGDRVLYRNPYPGRPLNDDEIATATLLSAMADWVRGSGPPPYPLAEGLRDQAIAPAIEEAADTGREVVTTPEAWNDRASSQDTER